jgi:hypothetical protein
MLINATLQKKYLLKTNNRFLIAEAIPEITNKIVSALDFIKIEKFDCLAAECNSSF